MRHLDERLHASRGIAGPSFVAAILAKHGRLYERPPILREKTSLNFAHKLNINRDNLDGKTARVLDAIVLTASASAGQIAVQLRILPQGHVEIRQVVLNVTRG